MGKQEAWDHKLNSLIMDFQDTFGLITENFVCPILYSNEKVPLCRGHIVNRSFSNASRKWTVQRSDIDNFYGRNFESHFSLIENKEDISAFNALVDKKLNRELKPNIMLNGEQIEYSKDMKNIPPFFTPLIIKSNDQSTQVNLKLSPEEFEKRKFQKLEISFQSDLTIPSCASLIKAAHLTMFDMVGYKYSYSSGGYYIGKTVLGNFFLLNKGKSNTEIELSAKLYFSTYLNIFRVVESTPYTFKGTVSDNNLFICQDHGETPWGFMVFINTGNSLHSVILPHVDSREKIEKYYRFLTDSREEIAVHYCHYENGEWQMAEEEIRIKWPKVSGGYFYK